MTATLNTSSSSRFPADHRGTVAAIAYASAWAIGLAAFEAGPPADASRTEVAQFFAARPASTAVQSLLVHGAAAVALLAVLSVLARAAGSSRVLRAATAAAIGLSFLQLGLGFGRSLFASGDSITSLANAIARADGVKMLVLAVVIGEGTRLLRATDAMSGRGAILGAGAAAALIVSGIAYLAGLHSIYGSAVVSLTLLIAWVIQAGFAADRAGR